MTSSVSEQHRLIRNNCENGMNCFHEGGCLDENKR